METNVIWAIIVIAALLLGLLVYAITWIGKNKDTVSDNKVERILQRSNDSTISDAEKRIAEAKRANYGSDELRARILDHYILVLELGIERHRMEKLKQKHGDRRDSVLQAAIDQCQQKIDLLTEQERNHRIDLDGESTDEQKRLYDEFVWAFRTLQKSSGIWSIKSDPDDRSVIDREKAVFSESSFSLLADVSDKKVPCLSGCYFYPLFVIRAEFPHSLFFKTYQISQISITQDRVRFRENSFRPTDSRLLGYTYEHVTKRGEPDLRYSYNPKYPLYSYGEFRLVEPGMPFMATNEKAVSAFVQAFTAYTRSLRGESPSPTQERTHHNDAGMPLENHIPLSPSRKTKYEDIYDISWKLLTFLEKISQDEGFRQVFEEHVPVDALKNALATDSLDDVMLLIFRYDVIRAYRGLGHGIDFSKKEGVPIALFICMTRDGIDKGFNPDNFDYYYRMMRQSLESVLEASESYLKSNDFFAFAEMLREFDQDLLEEYVVLLYRFASLVANADGTLNGTEYLWLKSIMAVKDTRQKSAIIPEVSDSHPVESNKSPIRASSADLDDLIGLDGVKTEIRTLTNYIKIQKMREAKGLKVSPVSLHCVFTGNPGTGKTTVARIVAQIYKDLGVLQKGHLVETDRSGLVAEYVGQTAAKTNKIIDSALDGVLFIDEAYSLVSGSSTDYGNEAVSTLLKRMEDDRDRLVVILAGYPEDMQRFIESNPGLQSRFNRYIEFKDYSAEELFEIFELYAGRYEYNLTQGAADLLRTAFTDAVTRRDKHFGNGRYVRNLFEKVIECQANRLSDLRDVTPETLTLINEEDIAKSI
jgi:ATPases of the AAA+ class